MTNRRVLIALWSAFAFVTWNVVFDRRVAIGAVEFTREQIARYQHGEPVVSITDAFTPRVWAGALEASLCAGIVLGAGGVLLLRSRRHPRVKP